MNELSLGSVNFARRRFLQYSAGGVAIAMTGIAMAPVADAATPIDITQKIVTGKMDGKPGWPKFEPADLRLPAHRLIEVTVRCYDDGAADIPGGYNKVKGTINNEIRLIKGLPEIIPSDSGAMVKEIPVKDVAHTFTVNGDNFFMNVPMPILGTVVYRFMTPAPGKYAWQCMAACGTGAGGWAGPMNTDGWMEGTITVS